MLLIAAKADLTTGTSSIPFKKIDKISGFTKIKTATWIRLNSLNQAIIKLNFSLNHTENQLIISAGHQSSLLKPAPTSPYALLTLINRLGVVLFLLFFLPSVPPSGFSFYVWQVLTLTCVGVFL